MNWTISWIMRIVKFCYAPLALAFYLAATAAVAQTGTAPPAPATLPAPQLATGSETPEEIEIIPSAHAVVQQVTDQMLEVISRNRETMSDNPQKFYTEVQAVLDPVVDFRFIARSVMGSFGRSATAEQRQRFTDTFKNGLVMTYARGMAAFDDQDITVVPPGAGTSNHCTVGVEQEVRGPDGLNKVSYTMRREKLRRTDKHCVGEWKLINVTINGVNLGKTFRSQFAQAMQQELKKKNGDKNTQVALLLDTVIDNWSATN
ncbi:MlaC/ttg2D family ABC transporter substrate-binding protein [Exilibacterium tricleocarpae]|nr:ABC transporter substrate-binding protein [Exilibacterium tricleocarpae]